MTTRIATGEGWDFWQIGLDVYRAPTGSGMDTSGHPMGKRWEASRDHWNRYRTVFAWATDTEVQS